MCPAVAQGRWRKRRRKVRTMNKIIAYYSASGVTAEKARELASEIGAAIKDLKRKYPGLDIRGGKLLNGSVNGDIL